MPLFPSIVHALRHHARERPGRPCCLLATGASEQALTFGDLAARAEALAARLAERAGPGDRALLIFPNSLEFAVGFFACLMAGIVAVPVMPPRRNALRDTVGAIAADCAPRLALVMQALMDDDRSDLAAWLAKHQLDFVTVSCAGPPPPAPGWQDRAPARDGLAFLQYTSGSTSAPKGVMVSHGNVMADLEMARIAMATDAESTHVSWLPVYHDMGLILNLLQCVNLGATCVLMTPVGFLHRPLDWLRRIQRHGARVAGGPNFAYDLCADMLRPEAAVGLDLSGWKVAVSGAEPIRHETMARFAAAFAPYGFDPKSWWPGYGLAEATIFVSSTRPGRGAVLRSASADALRAGRIAAPDGTADRRILVGSGRIGQGMDAAIIDPSSLRRAAPDTVGEIWLRGANVAQGYWRRSAETEETFHARIADEPAHGWLRTGDLGFLGPDGEVFITGRLNDLIIIRGANHYPQDIEATAAASHAALRRDGCAAFTAADARGAEQLILVQEVARGRHDGATLKDITAAIRAAVVNTHEIAPREVILIRAGTLPKTTSGKIRRRLTRDLWAAGRLETWQEQPATMAT